MKFFEFTVKAFILITSAALIILFALSLGAIIYKQDGDELQKSDCAIILYSDAKDDTEILEKRVKTALKLYNDGYFENLILTGGSEAKDKDAVRMRRLALQENFPISNIFIENMGGNIEQTLKNSKKITDDLDCERVIGISSSYNLAMIKLFANKLRFKIYTYPAEDTSIKDEKFEAAKEIMRMMYYIII